MSYVGLYINLDRSADRKSEMEAQFVRYGLEGLYERFPAASGNALGFPNPYLSEGEIGCFTSHYLLLKQHVDCTSPLHVVEDDAVFSGFTKGLIGQVISSDTFSKYDIIFTETAIPINVSQYRQYKELFDKSVDRDSAGKVTTVRCSIIDHVACSSSYIVNPRSISKIVDILTQALNGGTKVSADLLIRQKTREGVIRTGCLFPFVTSVHLSHIPDNTIVGRKHDPLSELALSLVRLSFFIDSNLSELRDYAEKILPLPKDDPHCQLLGRTLAFCITDKFRMF